VLATTDYAMASRRKDPTQSSDDRFGIRVGVPGTRHQRFIFRVLSEARKTGTNAVRHSRSGPTAFGRRHVAARFGLIQMAGSSRRVSLKARLVNLRLAGTRSTLTHLRYIRVTALDRMKNVESLWRNNAIMDEVDIDQFEARGRDDRHQFRFIVSPEDASDLCHLRSFTRQLMSRVEADPSIDG
jgi:hypothetical protein